MPILLVVLLFAAFLPFALPASAVNEDEIVIIDQEEYFETVNNRGGAYIISVKEGKVLPETLILGNKDDSRTYKLKDDVIFENQTQS